MNNLIEKMAVEFKISGSEKVLLRSDISEDGFKVDIYAPERVKDNMIAKFLYDNVSFSYLSGMNKVVGSTVIEVKSITGQTFEVGFNRVGIDFFNLQS